MIAPIGSSARSIAALDLLGARWIYRIDEYKLIT